MDPGTALGIVSLGVQVCQSLLTYYERWKDYNEDISNTCNYIKDLVNSFALLESRLEATNDELKAHVSACLKPCTDGLDCLKKKVEKLRDSHGNCVEPQGLRQKAWKEVQRASYPFRASTLLKLQEIVGELRGNVSFALQIVQLDYNVTSKNTLLDIEAKVHAIARSSGVLEASFTQISDQTQVLINSVFKLAESSELRNLLNWISPPDTCTSQDLVLRKHEPGTGEWLFSSTQYLQWRKSSGSILWLTGVPGSGKSTLCSLVIDRLSKEAAKLGYFYFSFSDTSKQSYRGFLESIIAQFIREPIVNQKLAESHRSSISNPPSVNLLETVLVSLFRTFTEIVLVVDALDELPEGVDGRQGLINWLRTTRQNCSQLKAFVTSRPLSDVEEAMVRMNAQVLLINKVDTNNDIRKHVEAELGKHERLRKLDAGIKARIQHAFETKADGMFRWAYCQLEELKKLKSTRPKYIEQALECLPPTLDAIYERTLLQIDDMYRPEALAALRWLAFESEPPTLRELSEVGIINLHGDGSIDVAERGPWEDILEILGSLISIDTVARRDESSAMVGCEAEALSSASLKIRLAHFTVKEYLTSKRIAQSSVSEFALDPYRDRPILAQSCLVYLNCYSDSTAKTSTREDLVIFPLLRRAARSWIEHSKFSPCQPLDRLHAIKLLTSQKKLSDWLLVYQPDCAFREPFAPHTETHDLGHGLYHTSFLGLSVISEMLVEQGVDLNKQGGLFGNALQAASYNGCTDVVKRLIENGADVNAWGGRCGTALLAASIQGHLETANILIENGADIGASGSTYDSALAAAAFEGHKEVVELLLNYGADTASYGAYGSALQGASNGGHRDVVELLLSRGYPGAGMHDLDDAVRVALDMGHTDVVEVLLCMGVGMVQV